MSDLGANKFSSKDAENAVKFLNLIAKQARFDLKVDEVIQLFGLLAWAQKDLVPKIQANVLEVVQVTVAEPELARPARGGKAR